MIELEPAHTLPLDQIAALFNAAFANYVGGDAHFTAATFAHFVASENAHLGLSQVIVRGGETVGFGLVARQGGASRLAAFGLVPSSTKQGIGRAAMLQMIAQARDRGDHLYELEVIEQNEPAVRLYQGVGFERLRRLVGYKAASPPGEHAPDLQTPDVYEVAKLIVQHGAPDLPWDLAGTGIARRAPPDVALALDGAYAVLSNPAAETIALRALIVLPELRRQGRATRLLSAIFARYPGKTWVVPAICPEETGAGLAAHFGFERQPITQFQMRLSL